MNINTETGEIILETRPRFATIYNHTRDRSREFATINNEESLTQQDDAKDADINVIVSRFVKSGQLPQLQIQALSGDFTDVIDYRGAMDRIKAANDAFAEVPAKIRERFMNDPARFMEFVSDKENLPELRKMGLALPEAPPPKEPDPIKVIVTNPEPPK